MKRTLLGDCSVNQRKLLKYQCLLVKQQNFIQFFHCLYPVNGLGQPIDHGKHPVLLEKQSNQVREQPKCR
ncbi:hypothetical protein [Psychrobacillus soli]|uniref:Uncharacterized protein n=1 Tax=Psychrobacillus soli TaxID=1543965 RepID=A0A544TGH9_9BACI|nr:hypothetical protein [Psychrobacillus soli]TQR16528.1 hypothetical protein FG383_06255 [Psychrobacillus soli]